MKASILIAFALAVALGIRTVQGAKPKLQAYITKVELNNEWPEIIQISHHVNRTAQNLTALYVRFEFKEDMNHLSGNFSLKIQHGSNMLPYSSLEMDYCEALHMVHKQYFVQMVFVGLRRVSNFPLSCPFNKNIQYYVNGFLIDTKVIPSYMPEVAIIADISIVSNEHKILQMKLFGLLKRK